MSRIEEKEREEEVRKITNIATGVSGLMKTFPNMNFTYHIRKVEMKPCALKCSLLKAK